MDNLYGYKVVGMLMYSPDPPIEPDEVAEVAICKVCGGEIYSREIYALDERYRAICCDCLDDEWNKLNVDEKATLLGYEAGGAIRNLPIF